jgi:hypothetical protein
MPPLLLLIGNYFFSLSLTKMKLILSLSLLLQVYSVARSAHPEEIAATLYQKASETVTSFFKTAGTPVVGYSHPTLRTESDPVIHERATAHFEYYKDSSCTELDYRLDVKINRCASYIGNSKITIISEIGSDWMLSYQPYDASCEIPQGPAQVEAFTKNSCKQGDGVYVKFNLIAHPLKSIEGGGQALVFYDNYYDCHISDHTNLARANMVLSWPNGVCATGLLGTIKAVSCDAVTMNFYSYSDLVCDQMAIVGELVTIPTDPLIWGCPTIPPFAVPFQALCLAPVPPINST